MASHRILSPLVYSSPVLTKFQDRRLSWPPGLWCVLSGEKGQGWPEGRGAPGGIRPGRKEGSLRAPQWTGLGSRGRCEGQLRVSRNSEILQGPVHWLQRQEFQEGRMLGVGLTEKDLGAQPLPLGKPRPRHLEGTVLGYGVCINSMYGL